MFSSLTIYMFAFVFCKNQRLICSYFLSQNWTIETPERVGKYVWCFIVKFEHISHLFLEFLLLTSNK